MTARVEPIDADYLVVGAGAAGMAFTDALVEHDPRARVVLVDRRHGVGGHWLGAYPFVRLHQASSFYGVGSTPLGGGRVQRTGPEAGLSERADQPTILGYYNEVLADRLLATGRVRLLSGCEVSADRRRVTSRVSGRVLEVPAGTRVVDARYLSPDIPAESPPRFAVEPGARVVPVNDLVRLEEAPTRHVVLGSGKTATDAVVWLLGHGVDPGAITWVRPRDPWVLDRAVVQPDPAVFLGMAATVMESAAAADSASGVFERLEDAGVMMRIDPHHEPTMAKAPTLGRWELELLRSVEHVVRLGRVRAVTPDRLELDEGTVPLPPGSLVVSCAADGLKRPPPRPIWAPDAITLQPVRSGFPCFGAALIGYVEATRPRGPGGDAAKNDVARPSSFGNTREHWAAMTAVGARNAARFAAKPDVADWASRVAVNPARVAPDHPADPALDAARERLAAATPAGLVSLDRIAAGGRAPM